MNALPLLEINLLGGFRVAVGGVAVPGRAWRQRRAAAVVKLLALAPSHYQHREQILETLWPELELEPAANNLRVALHYARRQLTEAGDEAAAAFLVRDGDGLRLGPDNQLRVDLDQFDAAVARVWRSADFNGAGNALRLYAGELLPEDPYEDWVADRRTVVQTSFVTLLARQAEWHEERGELDQAIAARQRQVATEPLDEQAHAALIRLLAQTGQSRQALEHYDWLVDLFERELAAEPEPETRELWAAIRDGRFPGERPAPVPSFTPAPEAVAEAQAAFNIRRRPPVAIDELVGRDRELAELTHLLRSRRLITLTGPGGVGKTRLALATAHAVTAAYPDGIAFVDLAPLAEPDLVLPEVARSLGVPESGGDSLRDAIVAALGEARVLVVVDNLEHVLAAAPELGELLAACSGLHLLLTSRARLRLRGEQEYPVAPLEVPDLPQAHDDRALAAEAMARVPAVTLFLRRASQARPDFALNEENARSVADICHRLDGLPLAIEMAAARVRLLSASELARRLEAPLAVLGGGSRDAPARQRTLRATIAWSYDLLQPEEQDLFAELSVFAGGATLDAIEAVAAGNGDAFLSVLEVTAALVDHSLLQQREESPGQARLNMLSTIREFARERLEARGDADEVRQRHASLFLAVAESAEPELTGPEQVIWLDRLDLEHDNLRAALTTFEQSDQHALGLRLATALWRFWWTRGYLSEGRRWLEQALANGDQGVTRVRARALDGAGALAEAQGDYETARAHHEAALAIWRDLGDQAGQVRALTNLGLVADIRGESRAAVRMFEEALALARTAGDQAGIGGCLANLGFVALDQGHHQQAGTYFAESVQVFRALGDHRNLATVLDGLGVLAFLGGDYQRAAAMQTEALAQLRAIGDRQAIASTLANLGHTTQRLGDYDQAERHYADALDLFRELGDRSGRAFALTHLGRLAHLLGDSGRAEALLREGFDLGWKLGERTAVIEAMEGLATVALDRGDAPQTARLLGAAGALREANGIPLPEVHQAEQRQALEAARALLGEGAFNAALNEGRTLLPEQAFPALATGKR